MKETLLQKAKKRGKNNKPELITQEHIELAIAWVNGEIGAVQVQSALGIKSPSQIYSFLAFALKEHLLKSKNK